ncbi:flippase [Patescibacteria group bacterium]|nr:flippase [Patescibacteria group bacterium]
MQAVSVTKNTTYLTLSYIGQKILSFFYFILIARFIGVEDLGKYAFALSFTTLFAVLVDFGLTQALIREVAKYEERTKSYLSSVIGIRLLFSLLVYGLVAVAINLMGYPEVTKQLVYFSGVIMVMDQFTLCFWGIFRGFRNLKIESISVVINQLIIVATGIVILLLHLPLIFLLLPLFFGSLFSLIFSAVSVRKKLGFDYSIKIDKKILKVLFRIAIPFALIAIFSRVYGNIDSIMLSKMAGDKAVGWYSVAMKIPFALQFIPAALAAAIFPAFSHHFIHDKEQLRLTFDRVMKFLTIIVIPISVGIAVLANSIILFFYGADYMPAVLPLQILIFGLFFVFLNFPLGSLLNGCDRQVTNTVLVGITMSINIILNIFLIPKFNFVGASISFLFSHSFLFCVSLIIAKNIIPYAKMKLLINFLKSLVSACIMGIAIYYLMPLVHFIVIIPIGALIYGFVMFLIRGFDKADIKYFYQTLLRRGAPPEKFSLDQ